MAAKSFPQTEFYVWNQVAPRIGVTYDLTGDGKTILKGNYGLFFHNPGAGVGGNGNPNTAAKSATYQWNDINGDRKFQLGEQTGNPVISRVDPTTISVDPDYLRPLDRQLLRRCGDLDVDRRYVELYGQ